MEPSPLTFVTMEEIFEELDRRFRGFILLTIDHDKVKDDVGGSIRMWYAGGGMQAAGLCRYGELNIMQDALPMRRRAKDGEAGDDD